MKLSQQNIITSYMKHDWNWLERWKQLICANCGHQVTGQRFPLQVSADWRDLCALLWLKYWQVLSIGVVDTSHERNMVILWASGTWREVAIQTWKKRQNEVIMRSNKVKEKMVMLRTHFDMQHNMVWETWYMQLHSRNIIWAQTWGLPLRQSLWWPYPCFMESPVTSHEVYKCYLH